MKHKFFISILPLVMYIITSCSKDKPAPLDTSSNNVSATISIGSNAPFQFSITGSAAKSYQVFANPTTYQVDAKDANNNRIGIVIQNVTQTGTYPFTSNNGIGNGLSFTKDEGLLSQASYWTSDPSIINKGSVTITVLNDHHIEGVFTASCKNENNSGETAQITNGSFKGNF